MDELGCPSKEPTEEEEEEEEEEQVIARINTSPQRYTRRCSGPVMGPDYPCGRTGMYGCCGLAVGECPHAGDTTRYGSVGKTTWCFF